MFVAKIRSFCIPEVIERITSDHYAEVKEHIATTTDELAYTDTWECCVRLNTAITGVMKSKEFTEGKATLPTYSTDFMKERMKKTAKAAATPAETKEVTPLEKANSARRTLKATAKQLLESGAELSEKELKALNKLIARYDMF